jgi:hypothetical protein
MRGGRLPARAIWIKIDVEERRNMNAAHFPKFNGVWPKLCDRQGA